MTDVVSSLIPDKTEHKVTHYITADAGTLVLSALLTLVFFAAKHHFFSK